MHLFDVINFYISLYNFGQTLRWFDSPRFLEWLIIWNGASSNQSEFGTKKKKVVGWRLSSYRSPCWRPLRPCPVPVRHRGRPTAHGGIIQVNKEFTCAAPPRPRSLPASFSAGNHHGFTAQFKALPALSTVIMFIRISDFWSFLFDYGQIKYKIYYVNS